VPTGGVATSPGSGSVGVAVGDVGGVAVGDVGGVPVGDVGGVPVGPVGADDVLAGAEKVLVDGDCVGVEDRFALVVGWTERVA
jgi:hypothetical protein